MKHLITPIVALVLGLVFGIGLIVSGMVDTTRVIGFLDVAGAWQPALAFVMGGAVLVAFPLFWWARKRGKPLADGTLDTPPHRIDARLLAGAAIFGVGWGLGGICPGPALVWLGIDPLAVLPFIVALIVGSALANLFSVGDKS